MTIKRTINGCKIEITLTETELHDAYYEQEHNFDVQDVENRFETMRENDEFEEYGMTEEEATAFIDEIAYKKRRNIDKYGRYWKDALNDAISDVLSENGNVEEDDDDDE